MWIKTWRRRAPIRVRPGARPQRGATLAATGGIVLLAAGIAIAVLSSRHTEDQPVRRPVLVEPHTLVDAALNHAWATIESRGLSHFAGIATGVDRRPCGAAVAVRCVTSDDEDPIHHVIAVAAPPAGDDRLVATQLILRETTLTASRTLGAFGAFGVTLGAGASVDSFDSRAGDWAAQRSEKRLDVDLARPRGDVRSNGSIALAPGAVVNGSARPGPMRNVTFGGECWVRGETQPTTTSHLLPSISVPEAHALAAGAASSAAEPEIASIRDGLVIATGDTLTITGPADIVVERITIGSQAVLRVDVSQGPVRLHVRKRVDVAEHAEIDVVGGHPGDVQLRVAGRDASVSFGPGSRVSARVLAPQAKVVLGAGASLFGSVMCGRLQLEDGAALHVDEAILDEHTGKGETAYELLDRRDLTPVEARLMVRDAVEGVLALR